MTKIDPTDPGNAHECIDCRAEVSANRKDLGKRHPRKCVDRPGPKRCVTHARKFDLQQRKQARARSIERTYDISAEDAHELLLLQQGRCWLCQKATGATKSLAIDHDHRTGEVRGRLCGPCNQFIGRLGDDPEAARRLTGYLSGDTPYRRLKAHQTLQEANAGSRSLVVDRIDQHGDGTLFAAWHFEGSADDGLLNRVRRTDGVWSLNYDDLKRDSEPRVETPGECGSCHALPDQPHTEYCKRYRSPIAAISDQFPGA